MPKEVREEIGLIVSNPQLIKVSLAGSGVVWDLYYFEIKDYRKDENGPQLEEEEIINGYEWFKFEDIVKMCKSNEIHEDRTVGVLLTYILNSNR